MERNEYMDFLRGCCILAVIIGHSITNVDKLSVLFNLIYSFHMPVLIFISAFLEEQNKKKYAIYPYKMIEKRALGLLAPYLSWNVIYSFKLFDGTLQFQCKGFWDRIVGRDQSGLWFLAVLFGLKCMHYLYWKLQSIWKRDNVWNRIILIVMLEMLVILLAKVTENSYIINMISYAIPYFFGILLVNTTILGRFVKKDGFVMMSMLSYFAVFQIFDFRDTAIITQVIRIFLALCIIVLCYKYQEKWSNNKSWKNIMCILGQHSLEIYLIHIYFLDYEEILVNIDSAFIAGTFAILVSFSVAFTCVIIAKIFNLSKCISITLFGK